MNLSDDLRRVYEEGRGARPSDETEVMDRAATELFDSGRAEGATNVAPA